MRVRVPELLEERGLTAYAVAQASGDRISLSALYRLVRARGRVRFLDAALLDALCDVLNLGPDGLLERETAPKRKR